MTAEWQRNALEPHSTRAGGCDEPTAAVVAGYKVSSLLYPLCGGTLGRRDVDPIPRRGRAR